MNAILDWVGSLTLAEAAAWLLAENVVLFVLAVIVGSVVARRFHRRPAAPVPDPLERKEVVYAASTVVLNWLITLLGWYLWKQGILVIRRDYGWWAVADVVALVLIMDLAMYVLHRMIHISVFYPIHRLHHAFDRPRPLDLFVLHPLENLAFGALWLVVVAVHAWSWTGISIFLAMNLASGTLGHLGVEPLPSWWSRVPMLRHVGTSTFHAGHHQDVHHNFGFYTLIWDRLFGTLVPEYDRRFGQSRGPSGLTATQDSAVGQ